MARSAYCTAGTGLYHRDNHHRARRVGICAGRIVGNWLRAASGRIPALPASAHAHRPVALLAAEYK